MSEPWSKSTIKGNRVGYGSHRSGYTTNGVSFDNDIPLAPVTQQWLANASGSKNPRWKDQIRLGQNATTGFTGIDFDVSDSVWANGTQELLYRDETTKKMGYTKSEGYGYATVFPPSVGNSGSVAASVDNRAKRKFLDSYQSIKSSIEAGQDFGEYKETLNSVLHPLHSLQKGMISYLSKLSKVRRLGKSASALKKIVVDTYLEFHFGWQPLADDVAHLIADAGRFRFPTYPISAHASEVYGGVTSTRSFAIGFLPSTFHRYRTTDRYHVRYKGVVRSGSSASGQIGVDQALRLTPENWLPTAWDLLPYSWIADYFVNIGDILQGLSFINADLVWGCKTVRNESTNEFSDLIFQAPPPMSDGFTTYFVNSQSIFGGNAILKSRTVSRSTFSGDDLVPSLEFKIPTSKYPFLNVGALLLQRGRSLVPFWK
ncbi:TPA_asm: maturation protein [ssRNA phage Zoerhiza.3_1]|jgi:hypothetical protein|uniref:Maturation protein n=2 Tax=Norzivirales TaxID=2842247 RepID=A0A8S5L3W8_9VIRU|nr:maturation protein [ssRNA phage Zoerhiza.3_1]QDH86767.1 MAG: hypothetical protein H3Rhizo37101_000004 [Leviviridae sp.]DAD52021.1 TPA_asm: maturation protein [ssRNA phage Zoerhiza.3_1]